MLKRNQTKRLTALAQELRVMAAGVNDGPARAHFTAMAEAVEAKLGQPAAERHQ